ncbi:hypothetical protein MMIC_P1085 [Mariprofundus micogutta]|uniref:Uncharacterized protein n=1 Tax=Mariprofundus micogutta TaxID=1921010 RepID=A0A1L8CMI8_9PROT|nr:hypothetical protein [Mariprofundus micogutta]GAV20123.1 hypothetical protein MMIC_P1085 [Mariprofundus micogutta]
MIFFQEQAVVLSLHDSGIAKATRTIARSQSVAQKGRTAVWTGKARNDGEEHGGAA